MHAGDEAETVHCEIIGIACCTVVMVSEEWYLSTPKADIREGQEMWISDRRC